MNRVMPGPAVTDNAVLVFSLIATGAVIGVGVCIVVADRLVRRFIDW